MLRVEHKVHRQSLPIDQNQVWFGDICLDFHDGFIDFCATSSDRDSVTMQWWRARMWRSDGPACYSPPLLTGESELAWVNPKARGYSPGCIGRGSRWERHLLSCQPAIHLGGSAQTPRFSERSTSPFSERHLAGFRNNLRCPVIPNAAIRWMLGFLFHDQLHLCRGVDDIPKASGSTITS